MDGAVAKRLQGEIGKAVVDFENETGFVPGPGCCAGRR